MLRFLHRRDKSSPMTKMKTRAANGPHSLTLLKSPVRDPVSKEIRFMKFERFWCCTVVLAMVFGCAAFASAQELVSGQARATQNNEFAAPAARVVANDLPQVTAAQTALHAVPSPRVRYSDQEWAAIKQQATLAPASTRAALTNALQPRGGAGLTPGAFTNFLGSNEDLGCSFLTPSDMGVAANTNFVVQAVNACYAVYLKPLTLAAGF